jgi:hypothetical protein
MKRSACLSSSALRPRGLVDKFDAFFVQPLILHKNRYGGFATISLTTYRGWA